MAVAILVVWSLRSDIRIPLGPAPVTRGFFLLVIFFSFPYLSETATLFLPLRKAGSDPELVQEFLIRLPADPWPSSEPIAEDPDPASC